MNYNATNLGWAERARIAENNGEVLVAEAFAHMAKAEDSDPSEYLQEAQGCIPDEGEHLSDVREAIKVVFSDHKASKALQAAVWAALEEQEQHLGQAAEYLSEQLSHIGKLFE